MKRLSKHRALAFFMAMVTLFLSIAPCLPVIALGEDEVVEQTESYKDELAANVGKQAVFDWWADFLLVDEETLMNSTATEMSDYYGNSELGYENWVLYDDIPANDLVLMITDYHYDEENGFHWYKLAARDGETLPEVLQEKPWILYSDDIGLEDGYDPYLVIYDKNDVIRIISASVNSTDSVRFVLSGPDALADATISITDYSDDYSVSSLAFVHEENGSWSNALKVDITKADGEPWTTSDGNVGILYTKEQLATDTYEEEVLYGAAFLYVDDVVYSATVTEKTGYEASDIVYTNSGTSIIVYEFLLESFEWLNENAYFTGESVTLYDNKFNTRKYLVSELPTEFTAGYTFTYNEEEYYWLENEGFIGSPYFIAKASDVTLGELPEEFGDGRVVVTDSTGNALTEVTLHQYQKPEITANTSLSLLSADVKYQWQIEYEDGKWVNIYGEDEKTVKLSFGMVATLLNENGVVNIRCETKSASLTAYSRTIPVTVEMYQPEEPDVVVSNSFVTSSGETVNVTVAGTIPEDASVELGETDSEGIEVEEGETVVAALDISIKNADGTEWQPESGETVTVTLEASKIGLENGDRFVVYHLHNGEVKVLGTYVVVNDTVTFEVDGFSKFVFALAAEDVETPDFSSEVGKHATLTRADGYISVIVLDEEPTVDNIYNTLQFDVSEFPEDTVFSIEAYKVINEYYDITDSTTGELIGQGLTQWLWYQVKVVSGTMPEGFEDEYWILQNYLTEADAIEVDALTLYTPEVEPEEPAVNVTVDGEKVTEITVSTAKKVALTATTKNIEGSVVKYQWQLLIPSANMWVAISGQTSATCTVNYGMVANRLDANGQAHIKCVTTADGVTYESESIAINISEAAEAVLYNTYLLRSYAPAASSYDVMPTAEGDETTEGEGSTTIYNVVIQYVFADGSQAANPWTATIEAGGELSVTINSPTVMGYSPDKDKIELDIKDISDNLTYTVTYQPAEVKFSVVHKIQNVDNEDYTEYGRITHSGFTDSAVGKGLSLSDDEMKALGIYDLPYDIEQKIAADGTTEVVITYDRYYFLMSFELGGGYGVEPIYARVGTPIQVGTPIRAGYAFTGWSPEVPERMPAEDMTITAQWIPGDTTYTVVYWAENANDNNYSFWAYKELGAVSGTTVSGSDDFNGTDSLPKTGFHFDHADQEVTVNGDGSTVVNVYYKRNTYTLKFVYEGGSLICDTHTHSATCYNLTCGQTEHTHTYDGTYSKGGFLGIGSTTYYVGGCYPAGSVTDKTGGGTSPICDKSVHTHSNSCYSGLPQCGLTGVTNHTHSVENGCYGMKFEGIKYGQDTSSWWSQVPTMKWLVSYNDTTFYTAAPAMPNSDLYIYGTSQSGSSTIYYYEIVDGNKTTNSVRPSYTVNTDDWTFTKEDYVVVPGFSFHSSEYGETSGRDPVTQYYIYYTRNSYSLTFKNGNETKEAGKFLYQADISGQYYVPTYNGDDPEGYTFAGWYTTEKYIEGTEWNHESATMPYNNLILYAKWVPVTHNVKLYKTQADLASGTQYLDTITVDHNDTAVEPARPSNGSYNFVGWFYMEDGVEKAFDFDIPVRKDLNLYGKWVADELATYVIKYAIENSDGSLTYIADDSEGSALAGTDKTFEAKSGNELYQDYRTGYYPKTNSHSMNILLDEDNTYTFIYVPKDEVQYTVKYLEKGTGNVLAPQKDGKTREAIHTENFVYISGYRPDAYQKRVILSANAEENEIIFWYEIDTEHAPVLVKHYLQNANGTGYNKANPYLTTTDLDGVINSAYPVDIIKTIEGFEFSSAEASYDLDGEKKTVEISIGDTQVSAVVTNYGLLIELYYDRVDCPYEFKFLKQGTDKVLAESVKGTAIYGSQVIQAAKNIPGYTCTVQNHSITIQLEDGTTAVKNVRIFYYVEETVDIQYVPVGSGTTNPGFQLNIPVLSGTVGGSTATPNDGYKFVGWYKDAACTIPVDGAWVNGTKITPAKTKNYGNELGYESATYYAKFEEQKVTINYVAVGPQGATNFGSVSPESETVKVSTGTASGSTATANNGYKFVGWYSDEDCTNLISNKATYVPTKEDGTLWVDGTTYYAKFEEIIVNVKYEAETGGSVTRTEESTGMATGSFQGSTATPDAGYTFIGWYDGDKKVSENATFIPAISDNGKTFTAKFEEQKATINYVVDGPTGCGTVGLGSVSNTGTSVSETIGVVTGDPVGSTASPSSNVYKFVGWYDANGNKVGDKLYFDPTRTEGALWTDVTYYAKFEYNLTSLTIKKEGWESTDPNQTFIFNVKGNGVDLDVTVHGNGQVIIDGITVGQTYTITEKTDWSWRYTCTGWTHSNGGNGTGNSAVIVLGLNGTITFTNTRDENKWLDGDSWCNNIFKQ